MGCNKSFFFPVFSVCNCASYSSEDSPLFVHHRGAYLKEFKFQVRAGGVENVLVSIQLKMVSRVGLIFL